MKEGGRTREGTGVCGGTGLWKDRDGGEEKEDLEGKMEKRWAESVVCECMSWFARYGFKVTDGDIYSCVTQSI